LIFVPSLGVDLNRPHAHNTLSFWTPFEAPSNSTENG